MHSINSSLHNEHSRPAKLTLSYISGHLKVNFLSFYVPEMSYSTFIFFEVSFHWIQNSGLTVFFSLYSKYITHTCIYALYPAWIFLKFWSNISIPNFHTFLVAFEIFLFVFVFQWFYYAMSRCLLIRIYTASGTQYILTPVILSLPRHSSKMLRVWF